MRRSALPLALLATVGLVLVAHAGPKDRFLPPPPGPDRDFYVKELAPWIDEQCSSCHRGGGGGALQLVEPKSGLSDMKRRRLDFERIKAFVNSKVPEESRLFLKLWDIGEGGDEHVGGDFFTSDDDIHDTLLDFVSGATTTNFPPIVYFEHTELRAKPGEEVVIDGRDSYDRNRDDQDRLAYWWTLHARPAESRVSIDDRRASRLTFKPDTGGTYVFKLRVGDGKVWCASGAVTVEVFASAVIEKSDPGGISGLEKADLQGLKRLRRLYLDVLGRPPTPAEAIAEEREGVRALVKNILLRAEMGRAWVEAAAIRFGLYGDFRPTSEEALDLALRIPSENLTPHEVERVLVLDPAFLRRHPPGRPLAEAVAGLLLGREPRAEETLAAIALAEGGPVEMPELGAVTDPRDWLVKVLDSRAFRRAAMLRRLERFLDSGDARKHIGRALNAATEGNKAWRAYLEGLLTSNAYLQRKKLRPKDTVTFVRSLFVDLLERKPTDREMAALVRAVSRMGGDTAALAVIVRIMIDNNIDVIPDSADIYDLPRWIDDRFLRYLGRRPTKMEAAAYGQVIASGTGTPQLVIQALLTGAEYACR